MNCSNCGSRLTGDEKFCSACGAPVPEPGAAQPVSLDGMGLHVTAGPGVGRSFALGEAARIGRGPENEVRLFDPEVSREHAAVYRYEQGFAINDLGSANGTLVNGEKIGEPVWIRTGDTIRVGTVEMQVTAPGVPLVRSRAAARSGPAPNAGTPRAGAPPGWLLWLSMGLGMLLTAAGVVGLIVVLGG